MIIVSNTSPLSNLAFIDNLHLLTTLYGQLIIPPAVQSELLREPSVANRIRPLLHTFLVISPVQDQNLVTILLTKLHPGEAEAIVLAREANADLLLIDERRGREVAAQQQLPHTGLLGILLVAKARNLIPAVKPLLDDLINKAGFRVSRRLYQQVLGSAGE